jgi:3-oxoacyl-[acyl-carrier protein] reductase
LVVQATSIVNVTEGKFELSDLRGKGVLITGASTGIGAAAALGFARHGALVALHYNSKAEAQAVADKIAADGGKAILVQGDLRKAGEAKRAVEAAATGLGRLDILFNNAGAIIRRMPVAELTPELYQEALDLNVRSVIEASQAAVPHMERQSGGAIINVGSIAGVDGGGPGSAHYACAKAYIHNLTRHMARDFAVRNIRVNAIAPGVIVTPFHAATPPERMEAMRKAVALGRTGVAEDCVGPVLFLASSSMSGYMTGTILHINGGMMMP